MEAKYIRYMAMRENRSAVTQCLQHYIHIVYAFHIHFLKILSSHFTKRLMLMDDLFERWAVANIFDSIFIP